MFLFSNFKTISNKYLNPVIVISVKCDISVVFMSQCQLNDIWNYHSKNAKLNKCYNNYLLILLILKLLSLHSLCLAMGS